MKVQFVPHREHKCASIKTTHQLNDVGK